MTSEPSLKKLGKHPGKQVQHSIATWGSRRTQCNGELSGGLLRSLEAAGVRTFDALNMPKVVVRPLRPSSCCFPHASPTSASGTGKQKTALGGRSNQLISLRKIGAGEGIRTLDPNLGKVGCSGPGCRGFRSRRTPLTQFARHHAPSTLH